MGNRYRLREFGTDQLVAAPSGLVRREHDLLSDVLAHLAELDERRLYLVSRNGAGWDTRECVLTEQESTKSLKPDNAAELFDACSRNSVEQVELLLAARFRSRTFAI